MIVDNTSHKVRKEYLDVIKLFSVLCVIHNHAAPTYTPIRRTISAFFMPVFFIIYGIASSKKPWKSGKEIGRFLEKEIKALLVPYVLWALIYAKRLDWTFVKNLLFGNNYSLQRVETNSVLWFLPCMFMSVLLFQILINIESRITKNYVKLGFSVIAAIACGLISCCFNGQTVDGGRFFGWDIAFTGCLFMIIGKVIDAVSVLETIKERWPLYIKGMVGIVVMVITCILATENLPFYDI